MVLFVSECLFGSVLPRACAPWSCAWTTFSRTSCMTTFSPCGRSFSRCVPQLLLGKQTADKRLQAPVRTVTLTRQTNGRRLRNGKRQTNVCRLHVRTVTPTRRCCETPVELTPVASPLLAGFVEDSSQSERQHRPRCFPSAGQIWRRQPKNAEGATEGKLTRNNILKLTPLQLNIQHRPQLEYTVPTTA